MQISKFRPKFTVRWLMIVVAVVAIPLGVESYRRHLVRLSDAYQRRSVVHGLDAAKADIDAELAAMQRMVQEKYPARSDSSVAPEESEVARLQKLSAYHRELARKYEQASHRPWLPIAPDPPEPK